MEISNIMMRPTLTRCEDLNKPLEQITGTLTDVVFFVSPASMICRDTSLLIVMREGHLREIVAGIHKTHPEILREIMCEECPEHVGVPEK